MAKAKAAGVHSQGLRERDRAVGLFGLFLPLGLTTLPGFVTFHTSFVCTCIQSEPPGSPGPARRQGRLIDEGGGGGKVSREFGSLQAMALANGQLLDAPTLLRGRSLKTQILL